MLFLTRATAKSGFVLLFALSLAIPTIIGQPQNQSIASGETATLNVFAIGQGTLTYQWFVGKKGDVSNPISKANLNIYTTPALYATARYWVRVCNADGCTDSDTAVITVIAAKTITLTAPNGGEFWTMGSTQAITWTTTGFSTPGAEGGAVAAAENVKIEYSVDGGATYLEIAGSTENDGRHDWTVPNARSTNALVKISAASDAGVFDVSDASFSIISSTDKQIRLSRNRLFFGANTANAATGSQKTMITNPGEGTLSWTAAADQRWIAVTPAAGGGNAVLQVGVNPAGMAEGTYAGKVTVSDPTAVNSPQTVAVTLKVMNATSPPFGVFATPLEGATGITGAIPVTGWTLDDTETFKVEIWRDPVAAEGTTLVFIGNAVFVEGARPDVEADYPASPFNYRSGWGYMLLTNFLPSQGNGTFKLHAIAEDKEGNRILIGVKTIVCDNAHAVKPFGTIDTPVQGGDASGQFFVNFGWVLTPLTKTVPKNGSTISVWVDGVQVGNLATAPNVYDQFRPDVATAFPGLNNSSGPVGAFYLDTTKYANGVHTIHWIAMDDAGAADGIGSRYFNIVNTGATSSSGGHREERSEVAITPLLGHCEPLGVAIAPLHILTDLLNLPTSLAPLTVKRGFDPKRPAEQVYPDLTGQSHVELEEVELMEIFLDPDQVGRKIAANVDFEAGKETKYVGYMLVGTELRPPPIGSTLDPSTGHFAWLPGPGFLGEYRFIFVRDENGSRRVFRIRVEIKPKTAQTH